MLMPFVLFLVLVIWGLIDGELYAKEALIYGSIWLVSLTCLFALPTYGLYFVVPACLVDIILVFKLIGNPSVT